MHVQSTLCRKSCVEELRCNALSLAMLSPCRFARVWQLSACKFNLTRMVVYQSCPADVLDLMGFEGAGSAHRSVGAVYLDPASGRAMTAKECRSIHPHHISASLHGPQQVWSESLRCAMVSLSNLARLSSAAVAVSSRVLGMGWLHETVSADKKSVMASPEYAVAHCRSA